MVGTPINTVSTMFTNHTVFYCYRSAIDINVSRVVRTTVPIHDNFWLVLSVQKIKNFCQKINLNQFNFLYQFEIFVFNTFFWTMIWVLVRRGSNCVSVVFELLQCLMPCQLWIRSVTFKTIYNKRNSRQRSIQSGEH